MSRHTRHRRKVLVDVNNHDRWIVSYADFITLLFAFFVVMYSISSVNEGKYKTLTQSLGIAFSNKDNTQKTEYRPDPVDDHSSYSVQPMGDILAMTFESTPFDQQKTAVTGNGWESADNSPNENPSAANLAPSFNTDSSAMPDLLAIPFESVPLDKQMLAEIENTPELGGVKQTSATAQFESSSNVVQSSLLDILAVPFESVKLDKQTEAEIEKTRELSEALLTERRQLNQVSDQLETALRPFIDDKLVSVKRNDYWIELEMNSELLFLSGESALSKKAQPVLKEIAQVINSLPNAVTVEGHTDNIPIYTPTLPSNWALSSARATSVVQELVEAGINPTRLSAVGYGEFHPIGDNSTEEGRFKNRRVTLVLMSQAFSRYGTNDEERAKLLNLMPTTNNDHTITNEH